VEYRLYFLDAMKHIKDVFPFESDDDALAIEIAIIRAAGQAAELWRLDRLVMRMMAPARGAEPSEITSVFFAQARLRPLLIARGVSQQKPGAHSTPAGFRNLAWTRFPT
jgi:hypothetical protein